jgi:muconolactone delta-isomerase
VEFLVDMVTTVPAGTTDDAVAEMRAREAARSAQLVAQGSLLRLWRPPLKPGEWRSWGLFSADDADQLETVLASMPLRVWRHDTVTPLSSHPSDPGRPGGAEEAILRSVLDRWKSTVDAHDPPGVAACFTDDAIFQGLHPYSVGPDDVAAYYDSQPMGMTAAYEIRETRRLSEDLVLGYLSVDFAFTDRPVLTVSLSIVTRRTDRGWLISHYQVSKLS